MSRCTPLETARDWLQRGFHPIPIPYRKKKPVIEGWPKLRLTEADLPKYFNGKPQNIGVLLGDEAGSSDVDLDCVEALAAAVILLPETNIVFGHKSSPRSHHFYRMDPPLASLKFSDPLRTRSDEATLIELRCRTKDNTTGYQTVVPGSVHECGESIEFEPGCDGHAANIDADVLTRQVTRVAAVSLLGRYFPKPKSGRNDAFLAIAGTLGRAGWEMEDAIDFNFALYQVLWGNEADRAACVSEVRPTYEKYEAGAQVTGIPKLKTLIDERVVNAALRWLKIDTRQSNIHDGGAGAGSHDHAGKAGQSAREGAAHPAGHSILQDRANELPEIRVNNRELRDLTADCLQALCAANHPPAVFVRAGAMAIVSVDENQRRVVRAASEDYIRGALTRAANFQKTNFNERTGKVSHTAIPPPMDAVRDIMERPCHEWNLPAIAGITESPLLRPDGTILHQPGYDPATRMMYVPPADFRLPAIPDQPTEADIEQAVACIEDAIGEFPFADDASRANVYAMLISQVVRHIVKGNRPIALIDAPQAGPGKTLIAEVLALIFTGASAVLRPAPHGNDEEWRKTITAILMDGHHLTVFDNVEGDLDSLSLALAVTASTWSDRVLGLSKNVTLPQNTDFVVTGNNIMLGGDLPRRCYWIHLDSPSARPWQGREFKHPDLRGWVLQNRPKLLAALLTMARAWVVKGMPKPKTPILGSFEKWCAVVGGILEVANVKGFLGNLQDLYEQADPSQEQWASFLAALYDRYKKDCFTVAEVVTEAGTDLELRRLIPDGLADHKQPERKLGWAFRKRLGRRYAYDEGNVKGNLRLIKDEEGRVAKWKVMYDPEGPGEKD